MKDGLIDRAIEDFRNRTLNVYKADPERIVRDARAADRAAKDHASRWLFELLQNSDDAGATEVLVLVQDDTVYVADNGCGLKSEAVSAICGTDFSDKTTGTIGRKGVGFKSVYEVSRNPQVLTVDGEGIEFSPEKTKAWLLKSGLSEDHVPYQWVPFLIPWDTAQAQDPHLENFKTNSFKTLVKLPGLSPEKKTEVEQLLREWPPHVLFAFRHLRKITAPDLAVVVSTGKGAWSLRDSRGQTSVEWRVAKHTERPSDDLLGALGANERQAISADGVSFLIAAPVENDCVVPTSDYLPVHVFYPTEQKGPVRLLLHAEFLVKSDRTALMPVVASTFNAWVADRLAYHVCKFVNSSYRQESPSSYTALLVPFGERASHPVAEGLWQRIADKAKVDLRLPDVEAMQRLTVSDARLISVSVRHDLARTLLEATDFRGKLLHPAFDNDKDARKALKELGCPAIHDQDLMEAIAENADLHSGDKGLVWACWEWLAAWAAKEPYGDNHKERVERARRLPIIPAEGHMLRASDLAGRIVTWKPDVQTEDPPDWLPVTFVEDWFRDLIQEADQGSPVTKLSKELGIAEPGEEIIQRAIGRAIEQYWKDKQGDPGRFLDFIQEQDWHETTKVLPPLQRCPVPLSQRVKGETWAEARKTYFGREWDNDLIAELYAGIEAVAWVASNNTKGEKDKRCRVLEWLGVVAYPRIIEDCQRSSVRQLPEDCDAWRKYLETARDPHGRRIERIACVTRINHIALLGIDQRRASLLIRLITKHWDVYYRNHAAVTAEGSFSRERYDRSWEVKAKWWWEVCEELAPKVHGGFAENIPLTRCWLPDKRTGRAIGDLLPVVAIDAFENDKDTVCEWLVNTVGLRTRIEQLTLEEWKKLLSARIPHKAPVERIALEERLRDKVTGWYAACLETVAEQENFSEKAFASCPLLCRKGDIWQYVSDEPRYLDDENDLAKAFVNDVWFFHIPARLSSDAVKFLGVLTLSGSVQVDVTPGEPKSPLSDGLKAQFNESLPYV